MCRGLAQRMPMTGCLCLWSGAQAEVSGHPNSYLQSEPLQTVSLSPGPLLRNVECNLENVRLKLRKQSFRL